MLYLPEACRAVTTGERPLGIPAPATLESSNRSVSQMLAEPGRGYAPVMGGRPARPGRSGPISQYHWSRPRGGSLYALAIAPPADRSPATITATSAVARREGRVTASPWLPAQRDRAASASPAALTRRGRGLGSAASRDTAGPGDHGAPQSRVTTEITRLVQVARKTSRQPGHPPVVS